MFWATCLSWDGIKMASDFKAEVVCSSSGPGWCGSWYGYGQPHFPSLCVYSDGNKSCFGGEMRKTNWRLLSEPLSPSLWPVVIKYGVAFYASGGWKPEARMAAWGGGEGSDEDHLWLVFLIW